MKNKILKYGINVLILVAVFVGTFYLVFRDQEVEVILKIIKDAKKSFLFAAIGFIFIYVSSEGILFHYLLNRMSYRIKMGKCLLISCVGFFFSAITPSSTGGQPVQVYYLTHCGIDVMVGTLICMVITAFFKMVLLLFCVVFALLVPGVFFPAFNMVSILFIIGFAGNLAFMLFLFVAIFKPSLAFRIVSKTVLWAGRKRILKNPGKTLRKAIKSLRQYEKGATFLKTHISIVPKVLLITVIQRISYFSVAYLVYLAFGLSGANLLELIVLQTLVSVSVDVLPLPGAAGASEKVFLVLLTGVFGASAVLPAMLLCRGITYYVPLIITALFSVFTHIYVKKRKKALQREGT